MIAVINFGSNNLNSIFNVLNFLKYKYIVAENEQQIKEAEKIILPGVGSFNKASDKLFKSGLAECIFEEVVDKKKPILGICLGMQLLASEGEEGGISRGIGLIKAKISKLNCDQSKFRLPHLGWNDVTNYGTTILENIPDKTCFYFVNSYSMVLEEECSFAISNYGVDFLAAVQKNNIIGTQFHPEKSRSAGLQVIKNFVNGKF